MEKFSELQSILSKASIDANSFYNKRNKLAGRRLRISLQKIKSLAQTIRLDVSAIKKRN